jgi:prophage antirepressor-like protein
MMKTASLYFVWRMCKVLNISRSSDLLQIQRGCVKNETPKRHGALDPIGVHKISVSTNGGKQELIFINEPNLYRVIFRSNKPEAINFKTGYLQKFCQYLERQVNTVHHSTTNRL